jgi:acid stress chaperone HdeA
MQSTTRTGTLAVGVAVLAVLASGCSEVEQALNQGGDTTCRDYVNQEPDTKRITITKAIKERTGSDNEPAGTLVDSMIVQVDLLCAGQRNIDTPIKNADVAGLFLNK